MVRFQRATLILIGLRNTTILWWLILRDNFFADDISGIYLTKCVFNNIIYLPRKPLLLINSGDVKLLNEL